MQTKKATLKQILEMFDPRDEDMATKDGYPKTTYLARELGRGVSAAERDSAWESLQLERGG